MACLIQKARLVLVFQYFHLYLHLHVLPRLHFHRGAIDLMEIMTQGIRYVAVANLAVRGPGQCSLISVDGHAPRLVKIVDGQIDPLREMRVPHAVHYRLDSIWTW